MLKARVFVPVLLLLFSSSAFANKKKQSAEALLMSMGIIESRAATSKLPKGLIEYKRMERRSLIDGLVGSIDQKSLDYLNKVFKSRVGVSFKTAYNNARKEVAKNSRELYRK